MKRYRRTRLTSREIMFARYYLYCFFNGTQSAILAGYSPNSAKWTAYRLLHHDLATMLYIHWSMERTRNSIDFDMPIPTDADLIDECDQLGILVYPCELVVNEAKRLTLDLGRMDKGNQRLARMFIEDQMQKHGKPLPYKPPKTARG